MTPIGENFHMAKIFAYTVLTPPVHVPRLNESLAHKKLTPSWWLTYLYTYNINTVTHGWRLLTDTHCTVVYITLFPAE